MSRARLVTDTERLPASSRYRLLARVASGGMATVYVGEQCSAAGFKRLVAIKRAHAHLLEDPQFRRSFVAEARLASLLRHRNIVSVTDVEDIGRDLIIVMDYVDGGALSDLLESGDESGPPLPIPIALKIIGDACAGLAAAHQARSEDGTPLGLVHRDVSPHNILIGCDGSVYLTDFGIAKAMQSTTQTETGVLKGKFAYMAPEYILGKRATQESDVFSMGVVLWEALTGRRLFAERSEMATLGKVAAPVPAPLVSTFIDADEGLDTLVARAVAKDPEARYASIAELHDALQHYVRKAMHSATASDVADVVRQLLGDALSERRALLQAAIERRAVHSARDAKVVDEITKTRSPEVKPHTEVTSDTAMSIRTDADAAPPSRLLRYALLATVLLAAGGAAAWFLREQLWIAQGGGRAQTVEPLAVSPEAKDGNPAPSSRPTEPSSQPERPRSAEPPRRPASPPSQPQPKATEPVASGSAPVPTWQQCNPYKHPPDPNCPR
jgi:serine/threonine-protein kinase